MLLQPITAYIWFSREIGILCPPRGKVITLLGLTWPDKVLFLKCQTGN